MLVLLRTGSRKESEMEARQSVRIAADSTMLRIVNLLMALSLGVHLEQLEHLMGLTWPRPFLLRPLFVLLVLYPVVVAR
jgi:hypothetical protein